MHTIDYIMIFSNEKREYFLFLIVGKSLQERQEKKEVRQCNCPDGSLLHTLKHIITVRDYPQLCISCRLSSHVRNDRIFSIYPSYIYY